MQIRHPYRRAARSAASLSLVAGVLAVGASMPGCATRPGRLGSMPLYPRGMTQSRTLDVQVFRDGTTITMTNTTARDLGPARMWLNEWYSRPIERFDIGQTLTLNLADFKDTNGEPFRAGGFFAAERPDTLVLAQLQRDGDMLGLIVIGRPE